MWTRVTGTAQLMSEGWGAKMILNAAPSSTANRRRTWDESRWGLPVPGVYRVVATGAGGGGGGARQSTSPGQGGNGRTGDRGSREEATIFAKGATPIVAGIGGSGGEGRVNADGIAGGTGAAASGLGVSASGGAGGYGGFIGSTGLGGNQATLPTPREGVAAWGGRGGGADWLPDGSPGGKGDFFLELVG